MNMKMIKDISEFIFIEDMPEKADAILIPGGAYPQLPEKAAKLWREGYGDVVIPSGAYAITEGKFAGVKDKQEIYHGEYETECDFYCDVLVKNGVTKGSIIREDKSRFTAQNAWFTKEILDKRGIQLKKAIICCKAFHARRCLMYYQFTFPETDFRIVPVKDTHAGNITKDNWYLNQIGVEKVMGELQRLGTQFFKEFESIRNGEIT